MIKRYCPNHDHCDMDEDPKGEYILYSDFENFIDAVSFKVRLLDEKIKDLEYANWDGVSK